MYWDCDVVCLLWGKVFADKIHISIASEVVLLCFTESAVYLFQQTNLKVPLAMVHYW